jgi:hypothetical protein
LLGWLGTGGVTGLDKPEVIAASKTDIVAHAAGFFVGVLVGAVAAFPGVRTKLAKVPQPVSGILAVLLLAGAWTLALTS